MRIVAVIVAVTSMIAVVGLAVSISNAATTRQIAENASLLHWTNAAQGSAALSRAATNQAILVAAGFEHGFADAAAVERARAEADRSLTILEEWASRAPAILVADVPSLVPGMELFVATSAHVLALVDDGDIDAAVALRDGGFLADYDVVAADLELGQMSVTDLISSNERRASTIALVIRLLVTLLIPGVAIVVYWQIARRQLHRRDVEMDARVAAQREMIAGVSHELRTPLTAIYGYAELLANRELDEDTATVASIIRIIYSEAADLTRMVDDLLTAARIDMDELSFVTREFRPVDEIESVIAPYRRAGHGIGLECEGRTIVADDIRFRQVIRNLVSNAVRYGGEYIVVTGEWTGDRAIFSVTDDGPGIDDDRRSRLFTPFVNHGHDAILSGSVGLGLAVSQVTAQGMGGELSYDDSDGLTTFKLSLPIRDDLPAADPASDIGAIETVRTKDAVVPAIPT
jgi:signal transduction histidine kinase